MGTFRNEAKRRLFIGLGILAALYILFVMVPIAQVPQDINGVPKSTLRIAIEGGCSFSGFSNGSL